MISVYGSEQHPYIITFLTAGMPWHSHSTLSTKSDRSPLSMPKLMSTCAKDSESCMYYANVKMIIKLKFTYEEVLILKLFILYFENKIGLIWTRGCCLPCDNERLFSVPLCIVGNNNNNNNNLKFSFLC